MTEKYGPFRSLTAAKREIARCHARLEIDHYFQLKGKRTVRVVVPMKDRHLFPDGISCRDATIKLLEKRIKELQRRKPVT